MKDMKHLEGLVFQTSNKNKLKDYESLFKNTPIEVQKGEDITEILSNPIDIITHKIMSVGDGIIVEDSTMIIDGKTEVEVKWKWNQLKTGSKVTIVISLGYMIGGIVAIYQGRVNVIVDRSLGYDGLEFLPFVIPVEDNPEKVSYLKLSKGISNDKFDPRYKAVQKLLKDEPTKLFMVNTKFHWNGKYQDGYKTKSVWIREGDKIKEFKFILSDYSKDLMDNLFNNIRWYEGCLQKESPERVQDEESELISYFGGSWENGH